MIVHEMVQGTPEWFEIKKGKMSASSAMAIGNCGNGLNTYVRKIIRGLIVAESHYTNKDIERGNELEPVARQVYEFEHGVEIVQVGFVELNEHIGCSPDGFIGNKGMIEIKARNDEKHFGLLIGDPVDSGTIWQMNMQMLICEREWVDFVSYNPNFKQSLFVKRFIGDEKKRAALLKGFQIGSELIMKLKSVDSVKFELGKK